MTVGATGRVRATATGAALLLTGLTVAGTASAQPAPAALRQAFRHGGVHAANSSSDAPGSSPVVDANGNAVNQPKAELTSVGATDDGTTVTLTATVAQYADPNTADSGYDAAWNDTGVTSVAWEIDLSVPGSDDFEVYFTGPNGASTTVVDYPDPNSTTPSRVACPSLTRSSAAGTGGSGTFMVSFPASCIGSPSQFRYVGAAIYDATPGDSQGANAVGSLVPMSSADPVPEGEPMVVAGGTTPATQGYWLFAADGEVFNHGTAGFYGAPTSAAPAQGGQRGGAPIISAASTPSGHGYYLVGEDGGVFTYGDAHFYGSLGATKLAAPIVAIIPTRDNGGYWLVGADGGVFAYGDAHFFGSAGGVKLAAPVLGGIASPTGNGYYLVARDGGVFTYGDARFYGSTGGIKLAKPVTGIGPSASGGYYLVAADGGVFSFGGAKFYGSTGNDKLDAPVVGIVPTASGNGYRMVGADGGLFSFGDAEFDGSEAPSGLGDVFVATAPAQG